MADVIRRAMRTGLMIDEINYPGMDNGDIEARRQRIHSLRPIISMLLAEAAALDIGIPGMSVSMPGPPPAAPIAAAAAPTEGKTTPSAFVFHDDDEDLPEPGGKWKTIG